MRPTFDRRLWILLVIILQCLKETNQQNTNSTGTQKRKPLSPSSIHHRTDIEANSINVNGWKNELGDNRFNFGDSRTQTKTSSPKDLHHHLNKCANCSSIMQTSSVPLLQKQMLFANFNSQMISSVVVASTFNPAKTKHKDTTKMEKQKLLLHAYLNEGRDIGATGGVGIETSQETKPSSSYHNYYLKPHKIRYRRNARSSQQQQQQQFIKKLSLSNDSDQRGGDQSLSNSAAVSSSEEQQQQQLAFTNNRKILDYSSPVSSSALSDDIIRVDDGGGREGERREQIKNKQSDIRVNNKLISKNSKPFPISETNYASDGDGGNGFVSSSSKDISSSILSSFNFPAELASSLPKSLLYSSQFSSQESESISQEDVSRVLPSQLPAPQNNVPSVSNVTPWNRSYTESNNVKGGNSSRIDDNPNELFEFISMKTKATRSAVGHKQKQLKPKEPIIIIDDFEEIDSGTGNDVVSVVGDNGVGDKNEDYSHDEPPRALPLRPIIREPYEDNHDEEMSVVYADQHTEIRLMCEVDLDVATSTWYKNGQIVHAMDRTARVTDYRFIKEPNGGLTINNVMLEDDGKWQCEAENTRTYVESARPVKLIVLDRPKPPYLLIDSRRLDAGNIFVPVKENSELNLACICEGGNPKPTLSWEVLLSPGVDRHAQKVGAEVLELEEIKNDKEKFPYKINSGAKTEARLPAVYRAHHNARILCVMEHPTLKIRQNASLLLDVQYTPSFAISRTPGFGYPLREGIEVSLKCDVDSNPPSTPRWQKDDGETPVPQIGDGFLNFTSIRREHSGWYKCTSRHLNFQYSSIGYYLSVRYDSVDVTSEPDDQEISVAAASHNPNKGQLEVQLGGAVTLQCPQGSLGCWSHLDPVTARLRGLGQGLSTPTGQFSLKDVVYHDAGTYKCIGQSPSNKKKLEVLQTVGVYVKGAPTVLARNATPAAYPGSPLHLSVEFCANPPAHAARWLHGDRVFTPGNQYGSTVLAYGVTDLPTPFCKEARLTYVSMHERVPRTFYFIVSSPGGVAEAMIKVNFTMRYRTMSNSVDDEEEELSEPEEIHFPVFGTGTTAAASPAILIMNTASATLLLLMTNMLLLLLLLLLL